MNRGDVHSPCYSLFQANDVTLWVWNIDLDNEWHTTMAEGKRFKQGSLCIL